MIYSKSAKQNGGSGFYFDGDSNAPKDAISVSQADVASCLAVGMGGDYSFDKNGKLTVTAPTDDYQLGIARAAKIDALRQACGAAIAAGFPSDALGKGYTYPCGQKDQANLNAAVQQSMLPSNAAKWVCQQLCADAKGNWDFRAHTAAQIQQVATDGAAFIYGQRSKLASLTKQAEAAKDAGSLDALAW